MNRKTTFFIFAALALVSCRKDPNYSESGFVQGGSEFPYVYASIADTKVSMDGKTPQWQKGDIITVYGNPLDEKYDETATFLLKDESDIAEGRFTFQKMVCGKKLTAVKSARMTYAGAADLSAQTMEEGIFPACLEGEASGDGKIVFSHSVPYSRISVTAASEKLRTIFKARVIAAGIGGKTAEGESIDTLNLGFSPNAALSQDKVCEYFFVTCPVGNAEVKCILYDTDGGYMETEPVTLSFTDGAVTDIPPVSYEPKKIVTYYPGTELEPVTVHQTVDGAEKDVLWAPVYCGYSAEHPNGLLYQYGRAKGQPYYPAATSSAICKSGPVADPADDIFYKASGDWYSGTALTSWPMTEEEAGYVEGRIGNPCPSGWRLPTVAEAEGLLKIGFTQSTVWSFGPQGTDEQKEATEVTTGFTLKDESGLFFAAVGGRTSGGQSYYRGTGADAYARLWCSDIKSGSAAGKGSCLNLQRNGSSVEPDGFKAQNIYALAKASGVSVRCVKK